jgi:type I restriction enzyme R subunit
LAVDRHLAELGNPFKTLVAFSGTVRDGGQSYTESMMNGIPETHTAKTFEAPEYRMLIAANKFQTGFDQPLLQTMYVDKKLGGVNAVQTLSRLNRTHLDKPGTMVLDFANEADAIQAAFQPYYETTILSEATDPNLLYEIQTRLKTFPVFTDKDVEGFASVFFQAGSTQDQLYAALAPSIQRFSELQEDERQDFRGQVMDYVRLYSFLAQVITFLDADLEKLYVFARHLRRLLKVDREELPLEIQQNIDMESYRIQQTGSGKVALERNGDKLGPVRTKEPGQSTPEELEALSRIIADLNERFGIELGPEHRITLGRMMDRLEEDAALEVATKVNTLENVRITFDHKVEQVIQEIVDLNFDLYKRITDDPAFGDVVKNHLFDQYLLGRRTSLSSKRGAHYEAL